MIDVLEFIHVYIYNIIHESTCMYALAIIGFGSPNVIMCHIYTLILIALSGLSIDGFLLSPLGIHNGLILVIQLCQKILTIPWDINCWTGSNASLPFEP